MLEFACFDARLCRVWLTQMIVFAHPAKCRVLRSRPPSPPQPLITVRQPGGAVTTLASCTNGSAHRPVSSGPAATGSNRLVLHDLSQACRKSRFTPKGARTSPEELLML